MDRDIKKGLVSGSLWVIGGKFFSVLCQLAVNALMARLLSPCDMGLYFLIFSLVNFFMIFSLLGMQRSIVRIVTGALAHGQSDRASLAVKYVIQVGLIAALVISLIIVSGAGQFISQKVFDSALMSNIVYLPAIWLILFTLQTLITESFRGYSDIRFASIFNGLISSSIIALVLAFFFLSNKSITIHSVLLLIITAYSINIAFALLFLRKYTGNIFTSKGESSGITRSEVMMNSWVLYFSDISLFILSSAHLWLLAYYSSKENVAIYGAVLRLMVIITTSLAMLRFTALPSIGHLYAKNQYRELENVLRISATIAGIPAVFGLLFLILFGKYILLFIYGSHYIPGYSALIILSIAHLVNVFTGIPGPLMVMSSNERYMLFYSIISGSIGITLSIWLVKTWDYFGVSIGSATAIILNNLIMVWHCKTRIGISTLMRISKIPKQIRKYAFEGSNLSIRGKFNRLLKQLHS